MEASGTSVEGTAPPDPGPVMSSVSGSVSSDSSSLRSRKAKKAAGSTSGTRYTDDDLDTPALSNDLEAEELDADMPTFQPSKATTDPKWIALALFSGAFAAFNGVFAKL